MSADLYRVKPSDIGEELTNRADEREKRSLRKGLRQHFKNYCGATSIHGFGYFGESRMWYEYVWWIIVFTLSLSGAVYMIRGMYMKWLRSPVLVSFATKNKPIYDIPFPAVTICPIAQLDRSYFNLTKYVLKQYNSTEEEEEARRNTLSDYMHLLCPDYSADTATNYIDPEDFFGVLAEHSSWISEYFMGFVYFNGELMFLQDVFKPTFTQRGLCYSFNRLSLNEIYTDIVVRNENSSEDFGSTWDVTTGYSKNKSSYPRRPSFAGMDNGLRIVILDLVDNNEMMCHNVWLGYTVTIHYPGRMPSTNKDFLFVPSDDYTAIPIQPSMVLTSETVKNYEPEKRDCYFPSEKKLKYFKTYTGKNCEMECLTNLTLKTCGCVEFYMPRENETKICGPGKHSCIEDVAKKMRDARERKSVSEQNETNEDDEDAAEHDCNCLTMCSDITYHAYVEPINVKAEQMRRLKMFEQENTDLDFPLDKYQYSTVVLYFKEDRIATTERNELYGPNDFISNFGGLLGLFTGFSILSFMEIIYFVTLRILGNIRLFGFWAGQTEEES